MAEFFPGILGGIIITSCFASIASRFAISCASSSSEDEDMKLDNVEIHFCLELN